MVNMIVGPKGSGKTKRITNLAENAIKYCSGAVLCVGKGDSFITRLPLSKNELRIVDTNDFEISNFDELYGLLAGAVASNYDIKEIILDGTLKIGGRNYGLLSSFLEKLRNNVLKNNINLTLTVSAEREEMPENFFEKFDLTEFLK